jgi:TldD protein
MDKRTVMAIISYSEKCIKELFVNRNKSLYQEIPYTQVAGMVVMQDREKQARLWEGKSFQGGFEHAEIDGHFFQETVEDCAKILYAPRLTEPGEHTCIFDPGFSGIFAHEAFGHGTETDMFLKNRAMGQQYLNRKVASELVNMYDSPAYPGLTGGYFFDHEGQLSSETQIIKDGILINGLTDLYSAHKLGIKRSPNGRREEYSHKAYARMTNTYFGAGNDNFDEILSSTEEGYLLKHASNGMEDPKGWGIQLEGLYLEKISSGKLTGEVYSPVIVTGYVPELLCSIDMVGNELEMSTLGMCGKGHKEWVKVTDGGPYLRLKARIA